MKTKIFKRTLLLVAMLLACAVQSRATDFTYNGLTYTILTDNTCETKQGYFSYPSGNIAGNSVSGDIVIPETVYYNDKAYSVTKIGDLAFDGCTDLTSVTIGNSVTEIGRLAFDGCTGLTEVTIPNSVTSIGDYAFRYCTGLTEVTISNSVTSIGSYAFQDCIGLTEVTIGNSVTSIGSYAFQDCSVLNEVTIPNSVTTIGGYAFYECTGLTSVIIGNSVTSIGSYAFEHCRGLVKSAYPNSISNPFSNGFAVAYPTDAEIEDGIIWGANKSAIYFAPFKYEGDFIIPNSVTSIGTSAFYGCSGLTEVTIPNSVTKIGGYAFFGCTGLSEVTIPNSVTTIGSSAFEGCTGLTEVTIPNSVTEIDDYAFQGCTGLSKVNITDLAAWCGINFNTYTSNPLYYATNLYLNDTEVTELEIPETVTEISDYAFEWCSGLTEVTIPSSVTEIGNYAFYGCDGITTLTIPNSVTTIGKGTFDGCTGLKWIGSQAVTPPTIQSDTFSDYTVPLLAASDAYHTASYWNKFKIIATQYTPTGTTFEVDGLKYEIISVNDLTCRLYAIDETVTGENVVIPETVVYKNRTFTPIEIKGVLVDGVTSVKSVSIPSNTTTISNGMIFCSTLAKLTVSAPITTNFVYASNIDELVIPSTVTEVSADLSTNNIGKITIEDSETELTTSNFKCEAKEVYLGRNVSSGTFSDMTSLEKVTISDKVTSISNSAFSGCTGLTEVTIPNSVTSIGSSAFSGCTGITELNFEDGDEDVTIGSYAFKNVMPTTAYLGRNPSSTIFYGNTKLTSITIGEKVTSIANYAFRDCTRLKEVTIGNSVTEIGSGAFYGCTGLTEVTIPNSVTSIGSSAFSGCTGLTEVNIPNSVTEIGGSAFSGCTGLTSVTIPNSVTEIGGSAFSGCTRLKEVTIPNSVTEIGGSAFSGCTGLTEVTISNSVTEIGNYAFNRCTGLTEVTIPNSVTSIGNYAFNGCTGITTLTIPNSVTSIGNYAFNECTGITTLNFEDGKGKLSTGTDAFKNVTPTEVYFGRQIDYSVVSHTALETVEFGENVTSIASGAFKDGTAIRTVVSRNVTPPTTADPFDDTTYLDGVLYVPDASIEAYQAAAGWKNFWEIKPLSEYSGVEGVVVDEDIETISVDNGAISVSGDSQVRIVALNGTTVYSGRGEARVNVTPGIYVVIVGNTAHKVAVR